MEHQIEDLYVGDDFYAQGELYNGVLFLHCTLYKHNLSTIKKVKKAILEAIEHARKLGYDKPVYSYAQDGRLSKIAGGQLCCSFIHDGKVFEVFKWD